MKLQFEYYLHDDYTRSEFMEFLEEEALKQGVTLPNLDKLQEKIGQPFYEVTLKCELDLSSGAVTLLGAKL